MELPSFYRIFFLSQTLAPGAKKPGRKLIAALGISLASAAASSCQAQAYYPLSAIKQQAAKFLTESYSSKGKTEVTLGNLDSRLRLQQCSIPLEFSAHDPAGSGGNISVQVQCKGRPSWSVHLPAQVSIFREIPVAKHDLTHGSQVTASDISWETRDIGQLRQEYLSSPDEIIGLEVKRNIGQGIAFLSSSLDAPTVIKRGDQVALSSTIGGISVTTSGTAMSDGRLGERIRIKNNHSARIITGTVVAEGKVVTL